MLDLAVAVEFDREDLLASGLLHSQSIGTREMNRSRSAFFGTLSQGGRAVEV